jgi:hypothetical protein
MVVMHAKNLQLIGILMLDNPQYPWKDYLHPYVPCFCPLRLAMREQSRCSTSQIVPVRVESIWEGVNPQILGL